MNEVVIIDYGLSNLLSVKRAFEMFADDVVITGDCNRILNASKIVLPGVGAFEDGMMGLREKGIHEALMMCVERQIPILGICLGMQMLFDKSYENGEHEGIGLIHGTVEKIPDYTVDGRKQCVPLIGWSTLKCRNSISYYQNTMLNGLEMKNSDMYFIHSYECKPFFKDDVVAYTNYGGRDVCAMVNHKNIYGCQFHPEKSGKHGLKIIQNFCDSVF